MPNFTDGIVLGVAVLLCDFLVWRLLDKKRTRLRFVLRTTLFACLSYILFHSGISPFRPTPPLSDPVRHFAAQLLQLTWWLQGALLATVLLDRVVLPETWHRERLFQDVLGALVFVAAGLAATAYVLVLPVRGLLATSGAVALVLGLAIQSTLNDVFSGVVLNATEPFRFGDSVRIGDVEGQVVGSNWRATRLLNGEGNIVVVPNSAAAKANVVNNSEPPHMHGITVELEISPEIRPGVVLEGLNDAAAGAADVLASPRPTVSVKRFSADAVEYEIVCYVDAFEKKLAVRNALFDLAWRHLAARDIALRPLSAGGPPPVTRPFHERLLRSIAIFSTLEDREFDTLSAALTRHEFEAGKVIYVSNDAVAQHSLHIVGRGSASVVAPHDGATVELRRMAPGDSIGQAGILAGFSFNVTVYALTPVVVFTLSKEVLTPIIKARPEVARQMCHILAEHRSEEDSAMAKRPESVDDPEGLMQWIHDGMRKLHDLVT